MDNNELSLREKLLDRRKTAYGSTYYEGFSGGITYALDRINTAITKIEELSDLTSKEEILEILRGVAKQ